MKLDKLSWSKMFFPKRSPLQIQSFPYRENAPAVMVSVKKVKF